MRHIFVVNPMSGNRKGLETIQNEISKLDTTLDYEIYTTKCVGDAQRYVSDYLSKHHEKVRFYACGGDGTINEVVNGAAPYPHGYIAVYPCGSGNDFVKAFGNREDFLDLNALIHGVEIKTDVMKVNERYCMNICHFGFDSFVAEKMNEVRSKPVIGGRHAYTTGVAAALLFAMKSNVTVVCDGEPLNDGTLLLCTVANGRYAGGKYKCAPRAILNDGLLDVCLVSPVSRLTFIRLVKYYAEGKHLDDVRFQSFIKYTRCKTVEIIAHDNFKISIDGEVTPAPHARIELIPNGLRLVIPQKLAECDSLLSMAKQ